MQTVWKGSIAFGMVSIPIRLVSATEERDVPLRQVHDADGGRIKYKRFCSIDGEEVPYSHIAKGFEVSDDDVVVLTDDDLANLPIASTKAVEVVSFADRDEINPVALSRAYFADPTGDAKPYKLLYDTLVETNKVAVVKLALRQRERLATIRPQDGVLVVQTMLWPDEVRRPSFAFQDDDIDVKPQELEMAAMFVGAFDQGFDPEQFTDQYREALQAVVDAKLSGHEIVRAAEPEGDTNVIDLMDALRASLAQAGGASGDADTAASAQTKPAARKAEKAAAKKATKAPAKKTSAKKAAKAPAKKAAKKAAAKKAATKAPAKKVATRKTA